MAALRVILFGAGGQLGVDLARECRRRGHWVLALRRSELDVTDESTVRETIRRHSPDCVLNAAAYNRVDQAEIDPNSAMATNAIAVRALAKSCREASAVLLHYSTDYVFDGEADSPYSEDDLPAPRSAYGVSKLAGEMFVQACCRSHYVLRVAGVYGTPGRHTKRGNFAEFVLRRCAEGTPLRILDDHFATPTYGRALASRSLDILDLGIPFGLYHLGGGQPITWLEFARKIAAAAGSKAAIGAASGDDYMPDAPRPAFSALSNARAEAAGVTPMPRIEDCLRDYMARRGRERTPVG